MQSVGKKIALLLVLLLPQLLLSAQDRSNRGREFWLGYGHNVLFTQDPPYNSQTHVLYLTTDSLAATVTVSVNGTSWTQTVQIPAYSVDYSIIIPKTGPEDARLTGEGLFTRGIHIQSTVPIVAYSHQYGLFSSAATMLLPVETYGYTYFSLNYTQVSNFPDSYSWFYVIAAENNTRVQITPSDSTEGSWAGGQTYTVTLNKGEIYNVFGRKTSGLSSRDMTGSKVVSVAGSDGVCHPVGVFSGSSRITLCNGNGGEILQQQIFPASAWGSRYLTHHTVNSTAGNPSTPFMNFFRVALRYPGITVRRNGVPMAGLQNGFYYEFHSNGGDLIEADGPVMVAQYTMSSNECTGTNPNPLGDPEMFYLSPIEQGVKRSVFFSTRNQAISLNFIQLTIPTNVVGSILVDGTAPAPSEFIPHPQDPRYSVFVRRITGAAAQHIVSADSAFVGLTYGVGTFESYGYNLGTLVNNLDARAGFRNVFSPGTELDSFSCPGTPFRPIIRLAYRATQIHWQLSAVPGLQPSVDSIVVNPVPSDSVWLNGRRYYTYTLRQDLVAQGSDTLFIPFSYSAPDVDACNQTAFGTIIVPLRPGPRVDFTVTGNRCLSDTLSFQGQLLTTAGFTLDRFRWDFPDGTTAATQNARKRFAVAGANAVRFLAIATNGCSGDTTKPVAIDPSPVAKFGVSGRACTTDSLLFSDSSVIASGSIGSWKWLMGEGSQLTRASPAPFGFPYTTPGSYTVRLVAVSAAGCVSDTAQKTITVQPRPQAAFSTDGNICLGDSVRFSDASSVNPGSIVDRSWRFGDNTSLLNTTAAPFYHRYAVANTYAVELRITTAAGCIDSINHPVAVAAKPVAALTISGPLCADSLLHFTSTTPLAGALYYWDFGNGLTATPANASATQAYGIHNSPISIRHVVVLGPRCVSDTAVLVIPAIRPNPVAAFTIVADTLCSGHPIHFLGDTTGVGSWSWDFGNGTGTGAAPITRMYAQGGDFTIRLTVKDRAGCGSAPATRLLTIGNTPQIDAGADRYIQKGQLVTLTPSIPAGAYSIHWSPAATLSAANVAMPVARPDSTTTYTLSVIDNASHCTAQDNLTIFTVGALYVPNAFTPNNDGRNDVWQIPGLAVYPEARVTVYNRWGEKVYDGTNYTAKPWRGDALGVNLGSTTFIYLIQLNDAQKQVLKGTVTIIR